MTPSSNHNSSGKPFSPILLCLLSLILLSEASWAAGLFWQRTVDDPCPNPDAISCGDFGHFAFSTSQMNAPSAAGCSPGMTYSGSMPSVPLYSRHMSPSPVMAASLPCDHGSCFEARPEGADLLVVDWDDPHGWSVGAMISRVAGPGQALGLLDLQDSPLDLGYEGVGDPQVIAQLCKIADAPSHLRPNVVNMSFGRKATPSCTGSASSLECELDRLLHHLRDELGVVLVAAAGNHGDMLFPAYSDAVLSTGSLKLSKLRYHGRVEPSPETPPAANILLPGNGLFLPLPDSSIWAAPPGSSYAAAIATGWIAATLANPGEAGNPFLTTSNRTRIYPIETGRGAFMLALDGSPIEHSYVPSAVELLDQAVGWEPEACPNPLFTSHHVLQVTGPAVTRITPSQSLSDVQSLANRPCPESRPCVPCHDFPDGPDDPPLHFSQELGGYGKAVGGPVASTSVMLDLSQSEGLDTSTYSLRGIYLRVDDTVYGFSDSADSSLLNELAAGTVTGLEIRDVPLGLETAHASLLFDVDVDPTILPPDTDPRVEISIPIAVHGH